VQDGKRVSGVLMVLMAAGGVASVFLNNTVAARAGRPACPLRKHWPWLAPEMCSPITPQSRWDSAGSVRIWCANIYPSTPTMLGKPLRRLRWGDRRPSEREAHPKAANQEATLAAIARSLELSPTTLPSPT